MTVKSARAHARQKQLHCTALLSMVVFILVLLFLAAGICQHQVSATSLSCTGRGPSRFNVRLEDYNLVIGISCRSESCTEVCYNP